MFVRLALKVVMRNDRDLVDVILLYISPSPRIARGQFARCDSLMLQVRTFEMRKRLSILTLANLRSNTEAVLKTYELFVYG